MAGVRCIHCGTKTTKWVRVGFDKKACVNCAAGADSGVNVVEMMKRIWGTSEEDTLKAVQELTERGLLDPKTGQFTAAAQPVFDQLDQLPSAAAFWRSLDPLKQEIRAADRLGADAVLGPDGTPLWQRPPK